MRIGNRDLGTVVKAFTKPQHRVALRNMMRVYEHPLAMLRRYLFHSGAYPAQIGLHIPGGKRLALTVWTPHDVLTINEIFCRLDYRADATDKVVVDFGSNVGISAAYFLTRTPDARVYLFEPLPANIEKLQVNLSPFEGRYELSKSAVGEADGEVTFGWEPSGRYGGVGVETGHYITVPCRDSNAVLAEVLARHEAIDILKVDIEGLEETVVSRIPPDIAAKIGKIYTEFAFAENPLASTHAMKQYGSTAQFTRLAGAAA